MAKMTNQIIINDQDIIFNINDNIKYKVLSDINDLVKVISLDILNSDTLKIEYNIKEEIKINFIINISKNIELKLIDEKIGKNIKSKYNYQVKENSSLIINKINDCENIREFDLIDLNEINSKVKYVLKTISNTEEHYDILVNHNSKKTLSDVITNGINIKNGKLVLNVTGSVPRGSAETMINQVNSIINLTNNKCQINPNLLIDEMDSSASHSAHISQFQDEDLFYLMSRGIDKKSAFRLLIKGLLINNILEEENKYIDKIIKKYWR